MSKVGKFVGAVVTTAFSALGAISDASDLTQPGNYNAQGSSHMEQRADRRERRRSDTLKSSTRNTGNRRRSSGQGGGKKKKYYENHKNDDGSLNVNWM